MHGRCVFAGDAEEGRGGPGLLPKSYVLKPVDGQLAYLRRGREVRGSEDEPIQEADLALDALSLHLSSALLPPPSLTSLHMHANKVSLWFPVLGIAIMCTCLHTAAARAQVFKGTLLHEAVL